MTHYIDKDVLVAEINKRLKANGAFDEVGDEAYAEDKGMCEAYRSILSFINTLEVKEIGIDLGDSKGDKSVKHIIDTKTSEVKEMENVLFKVKYAGSEYNVLEVKGIVGETFYGIEDKPNHIDYVQSENCEIIAEQKRNKI